MSSELAVVTAEIVDILPREHQTTEMANWVEGQLANGNTTSEMLDYCKTQFGIVVHKIESCELRIQSHGIRLDRHIEKTDGLLIEKLQTDLAIAHNRIDDLDKKIAALISEATAPANFTQALLQRAKEVAPLMLQKSA